MPNLEKSLKDSLIVAGFMSGVMEKVATRHYLGPSMKLVRQAQRQKGAGAGVDWSKAIMSTIKKAPSYAMAPHKMLGGVGEAVGERAGEAVGEVAGKAEQKYRKIKSVLDDPSAYVQKMLNPLIKRFGGYAIAAMAGGPILQTLINQFIPTRTTSADGGAPRSLQRQHARMQRGPRISPYKISGL
jgi:hypothetical protein